MIQGNTPSTFAVYNIILMQRPHQKQGDLTCFHPRQMTCSVDYWAYVFNWAEVRLRKIASQPKVKQCSTGTITWVAGESASITRCVTLPEIGLTTNRFKIPPARRGS